MKTGLSIFILILSISSEAALAQQELAGRIEAFFNKATKDNMDEVCREFYADDIHFVDPTGELRGIDKMIKYYKGLYEKIIEIEFAIEQEFIKDDEVAAVWTMTMRHKAVNGGEPIVMDGISRVRFNDNGKAVYHRDFFDLGEMVYERIPVLGTVIQFIKGRMHPE